MKMNVILMNVLLFYRFRHVQVNNDCAIDFYKKFGFEIVETREQYYKRIEPAGAHVLEKNLRKSQGPNVVNPEITANLTNGTPESHNLQAKSQSAKASA